MKLSKENYIGIGHVPIGIGAIIKGWDITEEEFRNPNTLPVVDFRAMTADCPWDCFHCFTEKLRKTLTLREIKVVIDQLAEMKTKAVDYLGEGEPTIDKDFFKIIEYTTSKGIQPIVFTDAATKMRDTKFVRRIKNSGASVCPKCDSIWNPKYQNWVVGDKTKKYFNQRNEAIELLIEKGFNKVRKNGTTRLGFDMVICRKNMHEVEKTLRYCRENNLWIIFSTFLPSGKSGRENFDKSLEMSKEERMALRNTVKHIDKEYGYDHPVYNNFATMPCVEFMCIYGDGRVSPCVGNETIIGNVKTHAIKELPQIILRKFPKHNPKTFDGNCLYRPKI